MDLESATNQLYAGSPDDFVERRKLLVAQARAAQDRPLATAIGRLRRPTRSAWLVNLYAREAPEELGALLGLGEALQAAQRQLSGPDLRRLSADRGRALAAATGRAAALAHNHGYDAPEAARIEVTQTLQAALADPEVAAQVRGGTVAQAQAYGGFGPVSLEPSTARVETELDAVEPEPEGDEHRAGERRAEERRAEERRAEERRAEERRGEAESRLLAAEEALGAAGDHAEVATAEADALANRVETLRAALAQAEAAETAGRDLAREARAAVADLKEAVRAAREAYETV